MGKQSGFCETYEGAFYSLAFKKQIKIIYDYSKAIYAWHD